MEGFEQAMGQGVKPGGQPTPQGPQGGPGPQNGTPATPQQQAQYNRFFAYSLLMLYDEKFLPKVQELFQKSPTPIEAAARVGAAIATRIYIGAEKQGSKIPPEVILYAGQEVMAEIAEMARSAGIADLSQEDVETAYYMAADMVRASLEGAGKIDKTNASQDFEQIRNMVGDDKLNQVLQRMGQVQQQTVSSMQGSGQPAGAAQ